MSRVRAQMRSWLSRAAVLGTLSCAGACKPADTLGTLVGRYDIQGVLVENTCGQSALPANNPLQFTVEIRQDQGVAYWVPSMSPSNSGSLSQNGAFSFTVSQSSLVSQQSAGDNAQPSDFASGTPDFDLKKTSCVVTIQQTVVGVLQRRDAADGGVLDSPHADAGASADLVGENTIAVSPAAGSDCTTALAPLGGNYLALPCDARYELSGQLSGAAAVSPQGQDVAGSSPSSAGASGAKF